MKKKLHLKKLKIAKLTSIVGGSAENTDYTRSVCITDCNCQTLTRPATGNQPPPSAKCETNDCPTQLCIQVTAFFCF